MRGLRPGDGSYGGKYVAALIDEDGGRIECRSLVWTTYPWSEEVKRRLNRLCAEAVMMAVGCMCLLGRSLLV